jgi:ankyrin repeat protein
MEVMMENSRKSVLRKFVLRKCFLTFMAAAVISMSPVQDNFLAAAPAGSSKGYTSEESHLALRRRVLVVLFALNSLGSKGCLDVNRGCLEFHLQQVCMPDGTIYRNSQGQSLFLSFNVEDLSAALGQPVKLPANADRSLSLASHRGQIGLVIFSFAAGANAGAVDYNGSTPLHRASLNGDMHVCVLLIASGVIMDATNNGSTPLHWAALNGHEQVCTLLIAAGANVGATNFSGYTPLHFASRNGHEQVCTLLIEAGADLSFSNNSGETPSMFARNSGYHNLATKLEIAEAIKMTGGEPIICVGCSEVFDRANACVQVGQYEWKCSACHDASSGVVELDDEIAPSAADERPSVGEND